MIGRLLAGLPGPSIRDVLILGDPVGRLCQQLRDAGMEVTCCPDLQSTPSGEHSGVVVTSLDDLLSSSGHWDAIVAVDGFGRIYEVRSPLVRTRMIRDLRRLTDVFVVAPARRERAAPDLNDLGPYDLHDLFSLYPFLTELPRDPFSTHDAPVILASSRVLGIGSEWVSSSNLTELSRTASGVSMSVRTFAWRDTIVKVEAASEHYFERCQALTEALFLGSLDDATATRLDMPRVRLVQRGRAVSTVVRDRVPGSPLRPGEAARNPLLLAHVMAAITAMAAAGLFHNDLRPWNILWDGHSVRLIDWAEAGWFDSDIRGLPQVIALAGTLAALLTPEIPWSNGFVDATLAIVPEVLSQPGQTDLYDHAWLGLPLVAPDLLEDLTSAPGIDAAAVMDCVLSRAMDAIKVVS